MLGRIKLAFGGIMLLAVAGVDYGSAANARLPGNPLGLAEHAMARFEQAKASLGLTTAAMPSDKPAPGSAEGQIEATLAAANADATAKPPEDTAETAKPAAKERPARSKPGQITVGVGSCTKGGAGKFCSVGGS